MIYLNNVTEEDDKVTQEVSSDDSSSKEDTTSTDKDSGKKQEQEKDIEPIDISLNNILILLHKRSKQELEKEGVIIYNGSFDEKNDKCKYLGPGTYFIRLMKMEGNELPDKNKAAELISKYIKRFSNNDIKINPDQLTEVLENSENTDEKTSVSESLLCSLFSESDEQPKPDTEKTEDTQDKEGEPTDKSSDSEASQENKVIGYMISYTNAYGKDKGKRISWGNALLDKLFGNTIRDLQSLKFKYRDTTINAGKMFKKETYIDNIINANTIEGELGKIINQDYPKSDVNVKVYTGKAVYNKLSKLNKKLEQKDSEKLGKNPYCITFTVDKKDPNYDQYSKDVFAGILSRAIGKQFNIMPGNRGNVDEKDIIYVPQFTMDSSSDKMMQELSKSIDFARLQKIFNSKNNSKQKETTTNESFSFSLDDKLLKFLFEDNEILIEKDHKRLRDDKWNEFVKKIKGHLDDIRARKDEIEKKSYQDKNDPNRLLSLTQGDEAKNNGYNDFKKELFDSNHNEEETIKNLRRIAFRDNFRNDIVTNFKYEPKDEVDPKQPDEVGNFIFRKFKDDNQIKDYINIKNGLEENKQSTDNSKKISDFIESLEIISDEQKIGTKDIKIPEIDKTIGDYEFISWEPDPNEIKPQKDNINIVPVYKSKDKDNPESTSVKNVDNNEDNSYFEHDVYIFSDSRIKYENENKQEKEFMNDGTFKTKKEPQTSSK